MKNKNSKPPRIAELILSLFMRSEVGKNRLGDFEEIYQNIKEDEGTLKAWQWYWAHTLLSIPGLIYNQIYWSAAMFKNYTKLAVRNMLKYKTSSAIKIFGFAISLVCCIFIYIYVQEELSYDKYHKDYERIYRVGLEVKSSISERTFSNTQLPLAAALKTNYPQIEDIARILDARIMQVTYKDKTFNEERGLAADPNIIRILDIPIIKGDAGKGLTRPGTVVISQKMAAKYFGTEDPVGKIIQIGGNNNCEVCAVAKDARQRKKEIGIRKVLGSSETGIVKLLTSSFLKWVIIGDFIAIPISYFIINKWLEGFAYKVNITILPFAAITGITIILAFFTISFQAVKSASANPVDSLRNE